MPAAAKANDPPDWSGRSVEMTFSESSGERRYP